MDVSSTALEAIDDGLVLSTGVDVINCCDHGLRGSTSPVLTATGLVNGNGKWQFSTLYRINTPHPITKKFVLSQVITSATATAVLHFVHICPWGASGRMGEI